MSGGNSRGDGDANEVPYREAGAFLTSQLEQAFPEQNWSGVASEIGVSAESLSRWRSGKAPCGKGGLQSIARGVARAGGASATEISSAYAYLRKLGDHRRDASKPAPAGDPPPLAKAFVDAPRGGLSGKLLHRKEEMTGRKKEIARLEAALRKNTTASICALGGMGGVGKTTLAVEVAHRMGKAAFPDGIWMLDMRGLDDPPRAASDAMSELLLAFESGRRLPEDPSGLYRAELSGRRMLLILDNARDADHVRPLLPPDPVAVMVTSRRHVDLGGELVDLNVLPRDEAIELLKKELRGKALGGRAVSDGELGELARLCGDLPLAISVVAAALRGKKLATAEGFIEELGTSRARGLAGALDVLGRSLELLAGEDAALHARFLALSIMKASFTTDAAAALWACEAGEAEAALEGLCERSLLQLASGAAEGDGPPRLVMHDLLREAAEKRLGAEAESEARLRHARYFGFLLLRCNQLYLEGGERVLEGLGLFDRERAHIEAGQAHVAGLAKAGDKGEAARLAARYPSVGRFVLVLRQHAREQIGWLEVAVTAARAVGDKQAEGWALGNLGNAWVDLGEPRTAIYYYEQVLVLHREIGDSRGEGNALGNLGLAWARLGEPRKAIDYYEQQLTLTREIGDRRGEGAALGNLGNAWHLLGEPRKAIDYHEQALAVSREIKDRRAEGQDLGNLGIAWYLLGEPRKAIDYYEQVLVLHREIGDRRGEGNALGNLGLAWAALGESRKAIDYYEQQLILTREIGDRRCEGNALWNAVEEHENLGEADIALEKAKAAWVIYRQIEDPNLRLPDQWLRKRGIDPDSVQTS